jgi:glycerol kinase
VLRPALTETTVLGAAFLAGLGAGIWANTDELADVWQLDQRFTPTMGTETRQRLRRGWGQAVDRSKGWAHVVDEA